MYLLRQCSYNRHPPFTHYIGKGHIHKMLVTRQYKAFQTHTQNAWHCQVLTVSLAQKRDNHMAQKHSYESGTQCFTMNIEHYKACSNTQRLHVCVPSYTEGLEKSFLWVKARCLIQLWPSTPQYCLQYILHTKKVLVSSSWRRLASGYLMEVKRKEEKGNVWLTGAF